MTLPDLLAKVHPYAPDFQDNLFVQVFEFAQNAHEGQRLRSGELYSQHLLEVAALLTDLKVDFPTLCAALLHDVPQRSSISVQEISGRFGSEIGLLVEGVTHLSKIRYRVGMSEQQIEMLRKITVSMTRDVRALVIKLASRLHMMRSLQYTTPENQERVAKETMTVYAPLADLLGIWRLRWQLEDISFQYLEPEAFAAIQEQFNQLKKTRNQYIDQISKAVLKKTKKLQLSCDIHGRFKHFYGIYRKMTEKKKEFNEIYDVFALRAIVQTEEECYRMLGIIHSIYPPVNTRFKDYVAAPKANGYQSIHTTVAGPEKNPIEFQIRTQTMHEEALYGVAAHWYYKKSGKKNRSAGDWVQDIFRVRKLWHRQDPLPSSLKLEILQDRNFIFTPKGDVLELPPQATPIDFAYAINHVLGHRCQGAIINNQEAALSTPLQTGDTVYIIQGDQENPNPQWLSLVKTNLARHAITAWLTDNQDPPEVRQGRLELEKQLARFTGKPLVDVVNKIANILPKYKKREDLYRAIADRTLSLPDLLCRLVSEEELLFSQQSPALASATSPRYLTLTIRTRPEDTILSRILKIFTEQNLPLYSMRKRIETAKNRFAFALTFPSPGWPVLYQMCSQIEQLPAVESVAKS